MGAPVERCAAVVLAGGRSARFGSDKLTARVAGLSLLDRCLAGLPDGTEIVVVGPKRPVERPVTFVREDPPHGGPTAGLVAGLRWVLEKGVEVVVVLPGDAPGAGVAAQQLGDTLLRGDADVVVAADRDGRLQPLQLALRQPGAARLLAAAGPAAGQGASARRLVESLDPPPVRVTLPNDSVFDIDTPADLATWSRELRKHDRA